MRLCLSSSYAFLLLAITAPHGWPDQSAQPPTFRTRVDAVMVDVLATDTQGRPINDLTAADFEIKETGKVQSIDSFRLFTIDEIPAGYRPTPITSLDTQYQPACDSRPGRSQSAAHRPLRPRAAPRTA
jgi:hypothetical protein